MRSSSRFFVCWVLTSLAAGAPCSLVGGCDDKTATAAVGESSAPIALTDRQLPEYQTELLDLAYKAASAFPLNPHIKNRSRAQEAIAADSLELGLPRRALGYIQGIEDWRRGTAYADLAFYCAQHDDAADARRFVELARQVSEQPQDEGAQDWPRDRIRVKIARTYAWLGEPQRAAEFEAGVVESESGKVDAVRAVRGEADDYEQRIKALDAVVAVENFDLARNAIEVYAQLFDRFYADEQRRAQTKEKIRVAWKRLPVLIRIETLQDLAGFALAHGDEAEALALVEEARQLVQSARWTPEAEITVTAQLAGLRHRGGEVERARAEAEAALAMFDARRDEIVNIYRAGVLRSLAEAYQAMGDTPAALKLYARAVEAGVENPNSRPRAEDLAATCRSMALHGVEPDAALRARMQQICGALGDPW